jgi:hypothetical protein
MEVDGEKNMGKDQGDGSGAVEGGHVNLDVDMNKNNKTGSLSGGAGSGERAGEGVAEENPSETVFQTSLEAQGSFKGDSDGMKADTNKGPAKEASKENNGGKAGIDADMEPPPAGSTSTETNDNAPAVQDAGNLDPPQPDKEEEKVEMIPMNEAEEALADKEWDKNFIDVSSPIPVPRYSLVERDEADSMGTDMDRSDKICSSPSFLRPTFFTSLLFCE